MLSTKRLLKNPGPVPTACFLLFRFKFNNVNTALQGDNLKLLHFITINSYGSFDETHYFFLLHETTAWRNFYQVTINTKFVCKTVTMTTYIMDMTSKTAVWDGEELHMKLSSKGK